MGSGRWEGAYQAWGDGVLLLLPPAAFFWVDRLRFGHFPSFFSSYQLIYHERAILDEVTCRFGLYNGISYGHGGGFSSGVLLVFFWVLLGSSGVLLVFF